MNNNNNNNNIQNHSNTCSKSQGEGFNLISFDDFPSVNTTTTTNNGKRDSTFELLDFPDVKNKSNSTYSKPNNELTKMDSSDFKTEEEIREEKYIKNLLINDFKVAVNNKSLNEEMCLSYLISCNNNLIDAANLFFQDKYGSEKLKVTFVFPDKKEVTNEFSYVASADDLFMPVYSNPMINNPELFVNTRKIEINPQTDKYIGNLNIYNNSRLTVKSN